MMINSDDDDDDDYNSDDVVRYCIHNVMMSS